MRRLTSSLLIVLLLAAPAFARTTGDPLDGNDAPLYTVETACGMLLLNPGCGWCAAQCLFAMIFDPGSGWDFGGDW